MKLALISAYKLTLCRKRISRKTPLASKALYKVWTINTSWLIHESLEWKTDLLIESSLCSSRNWYKKLKINLSNIFPYIGNNDAGL